ncbi:MAG: rod shape-determining protein MreD [Lachnospiraceae bacterium]|nr:rod shape-determining protein MreD [Lachnospiraceae bacterium]
MRRKIIFGLLILITFLLQTTVFQSLSLAGIAPNLLLILTVSLGFMRGKKEGMIIGFVCGLLIDLLYSDYPGINAFIYMIVGYLNGMLCKVYYDEDIKVPIVLIAVSDIFYGIYTCVTQFLFQGQSRISSYLVHIMFPEMLYTIVAAIIFYRLLYILNRKFIDDEMDGKELPWLRR